MEKKEYLNEKDYQEKREKIQKTGLIMMIIGAPMVILFLANFVAGSVMPMALFGLFGVLGVFGFPVLLIGFYLRFILANQREISSFMAQQNMPVAKEATEKMAPTAGVVAKEITKGVKEGLKEDEKKEEKK